MSKRFPALIAAALFLGAGAPSGEAGRSGGSAAHGAANQESALTPYIVVDPIPVSIIREGQGRGLLIVEFGLHAETLEDRADIEHLMPLLRDLYIRILQLYSSRDLKPGRPPDPEIIATRLQMGTDKILGPGHAKVLLRQLLVRKSI